MNMEQVLYKSQGVYEEWMRQLNETESKIMIELLQLGTRVRMECLLSGDKKLYMRYVKDYFKWLKKEMEDVPSFARVQKAMKKMDHLGIMKLDQDGLPLWGYRDILPMIDEIN